MFSHRLMLAAFFIAASCAVAKAALGCVIGGETDEGVRYNGYVTDQDGNPVPDATVLMTGSNIEIKPDSKGRFVHTENLAADQPSIIFVCKKPGYKSVQAVKKMAPNFPSLVLVTCTLMREG